MYIGQNIRHLRRSHGITAKELSEAIGKSRDAVTQYESGKSMPPVDVLAQIAEYFGLPIDRLVNESLSDTAARVKEALVNEKAAVPVAIQSESGLWDYRNLVEKVRELEEAISTIRHEMKAP